MKKTLENINNKKFELVDARSKGRFDGTENEPRPYLKSGSIPKSCNIPWAECIDPVTKCFLSKEELQKKFEQININKKFLCYLNIVDSRGLFIDLPIRSMTHHKQRIFFHL